MKYLVVLVISDAHDMARQVQLPGSLDQPPSRFRFRIKIIESRNFRQAVEILRQSYSARCLALIKEKPLVQLIAMNIMESINNVVEARSDSILNKMFPCDFAFAVLPA